MYGLWVLVNLTYTWNPKVFPLHLIINFVSVASTELISLSSILYLATYRCELLWFQLLHTVQSTALALYSRCWGCVLWCASNLCVAENTNLVVYWSQCLGMEGETWCLHYNSTPGLTPKKLYNFILQPYTTIPMHTEPTIHETWELRPHVHPQVTTSLTQSLSLV